MNINVKIHFESGGTYLIKASPSIDFITLKEALCQNITDKPISQILLFHNDVLLDDSATMESAGLKENDLIVCRYAKEKNEEEKIEEKENNQNQESRNEKEEKNNEKQVESTEEVKKQRKYPDDPENFEDIVTFIANMGFPYKMVKCALRSQNYNKSNAIRLLLGKTEEDEILEQQEEYKQQKKEMKKRKEMERKQQIAFEKNLEKSKNSSQLHSDDQGEDRFRKILLNDEDIDMYSSESSSGDENENYYSSKKSKQGNKQDKKSRPVTPLSREASHWTEEEEELLFEKWKQYGSDWNKIQTFFPERTKAAVSLHWNAHLRDLLLRQKKITQEDIQYASTIRFQKNKHGKHKRHSSSIPRSPSSSSHKQSSEERYDNDSNRKRPSRSNSELQQFGWTVEENELLFDLWKELGEDWEQISQSFPDRRKSTIIFHWNQQLKPFLLKDGQLTEEMIKEKQDQFTAKTEQDQVFAQDTLQYSRKQWTPEQDELLFKAWKMKPDNWLAIKKHFPSRTIAAVEQRWGVIKQKYIDSGEIVEVPNPDQISTTKTILVPAELADQYQTKKETDSNAYYDDEEESSDDEDDDSSDDEDTTTTATSSHSDNNEQKS